MSEVQPSREHSTAFNMISNPNVKNSSSAESNEQGSVINPDEKKRSDKSQDLDESQENGQEEEGYESEDFENDDTNLRIKSKENTVRFFKSNTKSIG